MSLFKNVQKLSVQQLMNSKRVLFKNTPLLPLRGREEGGYYLNTLRTPNPYQTENEFLNSESRK